MTIYEIIELAHNGVTPPKHIRLNNNTFTYNTNLQDYECDYDSCGFLSDYYVLSKDSLEQVVEVLK